MTSSELSSKINFAPQHVIKSDFPTHASPDFYGRFHDFQPIESDSNPSRLKGTVWRADAFTLGHIQNGAASVERSRRKSEEGAHLISLQRYSGGPVHGFLGDLNVDRFPGNIYLFDIESSVKCVQFPLTLHTIYLPKAAIGFNPDTHPPLIQFPINTTVGTLLEILLLKIFRQVSATNQFDRLAYDELIALLKVAIHSEDQDQSVRRLAQNNLRALIQSHIEANLTSPTLSLTSILQTFGASRASLFRMFEAYGGVRRYINDRRLYRAVLDISKRPLVRGKVSNAAEKWGFSSNANFNRAVKRAFGAAPSALINTDFLEERVVGLV